MKKVFEQFIEVFQVAKFAKQSVASSYTQHIHQLQVGTREFNGIIKYDILICDFTSKNIPSKNIKQQK